jgi:hypothetical protein
MVMTSGMPAWNSSSRIDQLLAVIDEDGLQS